MLFGLLPPKPPPPGPHGQCAPSVSLQVQQIAEEKRQEREHFQQQIRAIAEDPYGPLTRQRGTSFLNIAAPGLNSVGAVRLQLPSRSKAGEP